MPQRQRRIQLQRSTRLLLPGAAPVTDDEEIYACPWCSEGYIRLSGSEKATGHTDPFCEGYEQFLNGCPPPTAVSTQARWLKDRKP